MDSRTYWQERYRQGFHSGAGSYGVLGAFKAQWVNQFIADRDVRSVIDLGCGDGTMACQIEVPQYLGLDVSEHAICLCRFRCDGQAEKRFALLDEYDGEQAELALSMDVIYHLLEDEVYAAYMQQLFGAATRYVAIYSTNLEEAPDPATSWVRHRRFTDWIESHLPEWELIAHTPNPYEFKGDITQGSRAEWWVYGKMFDA